MSKPKLKPSQAKPQASDTIGHGVSGYDGANYSPNRSAFLMFPTNSRTEINPYTRKELLRKCRALDANLGLFSRIKQKTGQHAVGRGIFPDPVTSDVAWNDAAKILFENWASNPYVYSIDGSRDFWEDQRQAAETTVADGEFFEALVRTPAGAPMVQPLDTFEVETPWGDNATAYEDGVRVNAFMRPVGYAVKELTNPYSGADTRTREVPADSMIHIFRRRRAKQFRGLTWFYSGINSGIDALDLRALEMGSAKLHSALAVSVKGAQPTRKRGAIGALSKGGATTNDVNVQALESVFGGGMINYLGDEGAIELVSSGRPSPNILAFLEFLYRDVAIATGLPLEVVYNLASLGGATARGAIEDAQWFFEMVQDMIVMRHSQRIWTWRLAVAMKDGELPRCKDPQWWLAEWHGPAKLTVDLGRTADANIKLLKNGGLSYPRYYEDRGQNAKTEFLRQLDFLAWADAAAAERGIDITRIIEPTPGSVTNVNMPNNENLP